MVFNAFKGLEALTGLEAFSLGQAGVTKILPKKNGKQIFIPPSILEKRRKAKARLFLVCFLNRNHAMKGLRPSPRSRSKVQVQGLKPIKAFESFGVFI